MSQDSSKPVPAEPASSEPVEQLDWEKTVQNFADRLKGNTEARKAFKAVEKDLGAAVKKLFHFVADENGGTDLRNEVLAAIGKKKE